MGQSTSQPIERLLTMSELKHGDHIYTDKDLLFDNCYTHHGIYVGAGMVIHLLPSSKQSKASSDPCKKCGYQPGFHGGVVKTCLDCFLDGKPLYIFEYETSVSKSPFYYNPKRSFPPDEVIKTANRLLQDGFSTYNVVFNNCEDFASFCKTGTCSSCQIDFVKAVAIGAVAGTAAASIAYCCFKKIVGRKKQPNLRLDPENLTPEKQWQDKNFLPRPSGLDQQKEAFELAAKYSLDQRHHSFGFDQKHSSGLDLHNIRHQDFNYNCMPGLRQDYLFGGYQDTGTCSDWHTRYP